MEIANLRHREDEDAVAPLRVDLVVAPRGDSNVLLAAHHVGDRGRVHAGTAVVLPQLLAGFRIESLEPSVGLAVEHEIAGGGEYATDERLRRLVLPSDLSSVEIDRHQVPPLLF